MAGAVIPWAMNTLVVLTVRMLGSLLTKVTMTPPLGAGAEIVTGK